ncbi:MAG: hypothetical protein ABR969_00850 [Sedimentisphaerales bacterium]|jgi:hypothetical protein
MVRQLPIVWIADKQYFRDDRLEEFRAVDNPHDRITFKDVINVYLELINQLNHISRLFKAGTIRPLPPEAEG